MKILIAAALLTFAVSTSAAEKSDVETARDTLVIAVFSGNCEVLGELIRYSESVQMKGGEQFVDSFVHKYVELHTYPSLSEFVSACKVAGKHTHEMSANLKALVLEENKGWK